MVQTAIASQFVKSTGFRVDATISGGVPNNSVSEMGQINFVQTGHATLTPAGIAAILSQMSTYLGAIGPTLLTHCECHCGVKSGSYSVNNADLTAQQTIIFNLLATVANVTGTAS